MDSNNESKDELEQSEYTKIGRLIISKSDIIDIYNKSTSLEDASYKYGIAKYIIRKCSKLYFNENGESYYDLFKAREKVAVAETKTKRGRLKPKRQRVEEIINGTRPNDIADREVFMYALIDYGILEEQCSCCGFDEARPTDHVVPLYLDFKDGNRHNGRLENVNIICYNHLFVKVKSNKQFVRIIEKQEEFGVKRLYPKAGLPTKPIVKKKGNKQIENEPTFKLKDNISDDDLMISMKGFFD